MWRNALTYIRRAILYPSLKPPQKSGPKGRPQSIARSAVVSCSIGVLIGAGYGGYTHYKGYAHYTNMKRYSTVEKEEYAVLKELPTYKPLYRVIGDNDPSDMHIILFQYRTCPFCCKVRGYLDSRGISYETVEVDAVLRQEIKWSKYKKVPIMLVKVDGGYMQLTDSTSIISILETYLRDKTHLLTDIVNNYPINLTVDEKTYMRDTVNKYFIMMDHTDGKVYKEENEERSWREWTDTVLVHTLSPNVYRTPLEALETFNWFSEAGGWRQFYPSWEANLMIYGGATAMYFVAKSLTKRHQMEGREREALYEAGRKWCKAVKNKNTTFLGGETPNLADISVYGVLSSIEGCTAFEDLRNNTDIGIWYNNIKEFIEKKRGKVELCSIAG